MLGILNKFFDTNDREIKAFDEIVSHINSLEAKMQKLKDPDFPKKTEEFKKRLVKGEALESILPEAFALVREASVRTLGMRHFDVQLMAAAALSSGKIAEQKTGEGKTMSAVPALYLNSLTGKSVHLVTVNDYLARRDAGWMGPIFHLLGISIASIINGQSFVYDPKHKDTSTTDERLSHLKPISRKEAYLCDVVYGINSEFGFDYLRDNMAQSLKQIAQRDFYFAIVDEVDSVLIDEARTPHIISAPDESPSKRYYEYSEIVKKLSSDIDYKVDEKLKTAHLTDHGIGKIEKMFGISNIYEKDFDTVYHLEAALKARTLFQKEKDYIVRDNQVILVDEFTGRLMEGRRLSEGLHQAIEAKENVPIQRESKTLATVSLQNYFRKYEKLAGMTGTAVTESEEFKKIYGLDVVVIPTHNPMTRIDMTDAVYKTTRAKYTAVSQAIEEAHKTGQPVLIGTTSIDKNEIIAQLLKRRKIPHQVLNAKNHEKEAEIIAQAGKKGAVTVATNMAGRGVDIVLGGDAPNAKKTSLEYKKWQKDHDEVLKLGGLFVIGTERHESRRIDNQLRGRSGRQGDPGRTRFFVALDDEIMRLFGGDKIAGIMTRFNMPEDVPLDHPFVSKAIENAQVKVEKFHFDSRKQLVEYDDVLNKQREIIYGRRREILETEGSEEKAGVRLTDDVLEKIDSAISSLVSVRMQEAATGNVGDANEQIIEDFVTILPIDENSKKQLHKQLTQRSEQEEKKEYLQKIAEDIYKKREEQVGEETASQIERFVLMTSIDKLWMDHLDSMDNLRQGIGLQGYAQKDPLVEYKNEGFRKFESLLFAIDDEVAHRIFKVHIHPSANSQQDSAHAGHVHPSASSHQSNGQVGQVHVPVEQNLLKHAVENVPESEVSTQGKIKVKTPEAPAKIAATASGKSKLGRNDPCWCGSGKKYKKCHFPN